MTEKRPWPRGLTTSTAFNACGGLAAADNAAGSILTATVCRSGFGPTVAIGVAVFQPMKPSSH